MTWRWVRTVEQEPSQGGHLYLVIDAHGAYRLLKFYEVGDGSEWSDESGSIHAAPEFWTELPTRPEFSR